MDQAASVPKPAGPDVPGDHKCYRVHAPGPSSINLDVALIDEFLGLSTTATVRKPVDFCNPANKNGEGIPDPEAHLTCYDLKEKNTPGLPTVTVSTQFGEGTVLLGRAKRLCVPTIKTAVDGEPTNVELPLDDLEDTLNHFKCYQRKGKPPKGTGAVVQLDDQFESKRTLVDEDPFFVCNAVDKNGEGINPAPAAQHLACFKTKDESGQPKFPITSVSGENQFNAPLELELDKGRLLCVPANLRVESL